MLLSKDIVQYCKNEDTTDFTKVHWDDFRTYFDVKPFGLTINEIELLRYLATGPKSLTTISGKLNLDISTVRKEVELFCLSKGLIIIDGKRRITKKGIDILKEIDKIEP